MAGIDTETMGDAWEGFEVVARVSATNKLNNYIYMYIYIYIYV